MAGTAPKQKPESNSHNWAPPLQELHNSLSVQAKLEIGQPGDKYEQEADQMADKVMMAPYDRSNMVMMAPNPDNPTLRMQPIPKKNMLMMDGSSGKHTTQIKPQDQKKDIKSEDASTDEPIEMEAMGETIAKVEEEQIQMVPDIQKQDQCDSLSADHTVTMHIVAPGENSWTIARAYWPVSTETFIGEVAACIKELNDLDESMTILPGDELHIPIPVTSTETETPTVEPVTDPETSTTADESAGEAASSTPMCDSLSADYTVSIHIVAPGENSWAIARAYWPVSNEVFIGEVSACIRELNGLDEGMSMLPGDELRIPIPVTGTETESPTVESTTATATGLEPSHVAGDLTGTKIIRLALTVDDGPTTARSKKMDANLGARNATWYVQYDKILGNETENFKFLLDAQTAGGEIAIHSFHHSSNHAVWFPIPDAPHDSYSFPYEGKTEDFIMNDATDGLQGFYDKLIEKGLIPKFVRLPGGLISELDLYGSRMGISDSGKLASKIINGGDISSFGEPGEAIKKDYDVMKAKLSSMNLLLWRGDSEAQEIHNISWEAESASGPDNMPERFISLANSMKDGTDRSLVILTHDTKDKYVTGFEADIKAMEKYGADNGVKIEYYTMSQLFELETGQDPETINVQY